MQNMDDMTLMMYLAFVLTIGLVMGWFMTLMQSKAGMRILFGKWFKWRLAMVSDGRGVTHFERLYKHNDKRAFFKDHKTGRPRFLDNGAFESNIVPLRIDAVEVSPYTVVDQWSIDSKSGRAITQIVALARGLSPTTKEEIKLIAGEARAKDSAGVYKYPMIAAIPQKENFKIMELLYCDWLELEQKARKYIVMNENDLPDTHGKGATYKFTKEYKEQVNEKKDQIATELVEQVKRLREDCKEEPVKDGMCVYDTAYNSVVRPAYDWLIEQIDSDNERGKEDEKKEAEKKHDRTMQVIYILGGVSIFVVIILVAVKSVGIL